MAVCSYCDKTIEKGTGKIVVQKTGKLSYYCSRKCEKNAVKLKRDPRKFKWTGKREKQVKQ